MLMTKPNRTQQDGRSERRGKLLRIELPNAALKPGTRPAGALRPKRVIPYEAMTEAQKRIVDAAERPGIPVPTHLSDEDLRAYLLAKLT